MADPDDVFLIRTHDVQASHLRLYKRAALDDNKPFRLEVKQYIPRNNADPQPGHVTIIVAGGVGHGKELYEPLFAEILLRLSSRNVKVRGIWIADSVAMGQSAWKNIENLGNQVSWWDHSRDLLHIINLFNADMPRPIIGLGHSMGGAQIAYLATIHPSLFTSLILIEPAIYATLSRKVTVYQARGMLRRREVWPNRAAAEEAISINPYYARWDPRVLRRHLKYGLRSLPEEHYRFHALAQDPKPQMPVHSTAWKELEVAHLFRLNDRGIGMAGQEKLTLEDREELPDMDCSAPEQAPLHSPGARQMYHLLPELRPWVLYVDGTGSPSSPKHIREDRLQHTGTGVGGSGGVKLGTVRQCLIENGLHTMPLDNDLFKVADAASKFIQDEMVRWRSTEQADANTDFLARATRVVPPSLDPKLVNSIRNYEREVDRLSKLKL